MTDRAVTAISLAGVRKLLAADTKPGERALEVIDNILGTLIVLSPAFAGAAALPLLAIIEPKNELIKIGKAIIQALGKSDDYDFSRRAEKIAAAHCLITYTAYFDALTRELPALVKITGLKSEPEIRKIIVYGNRSDNKRIAKNSRGIESDNSPGLSELLITMPHPAESPEETLSKRRVLYDDLSKATLQYLQNAELWSTLDQAQRDAIPDRILAKVPDKALDTYEAQFLSIAVEFPEFFIWATLKNARENQTTAFRISQQVREGRDLALAAMGQVDIGLNRLAEAISFIAESRSSATDASSTAAVVSNALHLEYEDRVGRPVIEDSYGDSDQENLELAFPSKQAAFVPQSYQVARFDPDHFKPGLEKDWLQMDTYDDLGPFIIRYLSAAYSTETPLLILGHPGSGKSLLSEMLAARLIFPTYTVVRIPLRDIDSDSELQGQIEDQIRNDTGRTVGWAEFAEALSASPPVIILDGYDELLQASGKVFADYLQGVRRFQHREATHGRPVRVIVTSRLTLIDKANIPIGSTIVRLLDFDELRQQKWIDVWNGANQRHYLSSHVTPFQLPTSSKLRGLSGQPLLLLMLAVYDSESNRLSHEVDIDQTELYSNLLRRFIYRERAKGADGREFIAMPLSEQSKIIDQDMARLGVAAIGMFNRQSLNIHQNELSADIEYFGMEQLRRASSGRVLTQADLLLGSFFFIHESRARGGRADQANEQTSTAFEFLHNTFGEFLAADCILRYVYETISEIQELRTSANLQAMLPGRLTAMNEHWLACFIHTPLDTRPVVVTMLRDWAGHYLDQTGAERSQLLGSLKLVVETQIKTILDGYSIVDMSERGHMQVPYSRLPMLGHLAIYSLNLLELYVILSAEGAELVDSDISSNFGGCKPWERLIYLWRSWLSVEALEQSASVLRARRMADRVCFRSPDANDFPHWTRSGRLGAIYAGAAGIGDNVLAGLAGINLLEKFGGPPEVIDAIGTTLLSSSLETSEITATQGALVRSDGDPTSLARIVAAEFGSLDVNEFTVGKDSLSSPKNCVPNRTRIAELISRLPSSMAASREFGCHAGSLAQVSQIGSRYECELMVSLHSTIEPRWLPDLLGVPKETDRRASRFGWEAWRAFFNSPSAAPVLRAARELLPKSFLAEAFGNMRKDFASSSPGFYDEETVMLVAVLAYAAGELGIVRIALTELNVGLKNRPDWQLARVPLSSLGVLVDVLVGDARLVEFRADLASTIETQKAVLPKDRDLADLPHLEFMIQCERIRFGPTGPTLPVVHEMDLMNYVLYRSLRFMKVVMLLVRLGRERNEPGWVVSVFNNYKRGHLDRSASRVKDTELYKLLREDLTNPTVVEVEDLSWAGGLKVS